MAYTKKLFFVVLALLLVLRGWSLHLHPEETIDGLIPCCTVCAKKCNDFSGQVSELCYIRCARKNCHTFCAIPKILGEKLKING